MPNKVTFTPSQQQDIVAKYRAGTTAQAIADEYGTRAAVRVLVEAGVYQRGRKFQGRLTPDQKAEIERRYLEGETQTSLAKAFGCDRTNIHVMLKRRGIPMRSGERYLLDDATAELIRSRRAEGLPFSRIADELGVPPFRVQKWGRRLGVSDFIQKHGEEHHAWRGGHVDSRGYRHILIAPDDPLREMAPQSMYVPEHRLVMARSLGRPLLATETVHHINGVRDDNRIENLQLRQGKHGNGQVLVCNDCGSHNISHAPIG